MSYDELVVELRKPQTADEFCVALEAVETLVREAGPAYWDAEQEQRVEDTILAVLLTKMRFYTVVLSAQHLLIRDLRSELGQP
jgi:hypothetical protein